MENGLGGLPIHYQNLQQQYRTNRQPEPAVVEEMTVKGAAFFGAGVEDVENLEQHKGVEG